MTDRFPAAVLPTAQGRVPAEWTDYNGHMNVAYYVLAFDRGTDGLLAQLGMAPDAVQLDAGGSAFVLEMHVTYDRELTLDDEWSVHSQLIDADHKRIHLFHEMRHAREGWLAASNEVIAMHIDMASRRSARFRRMCNAAWMRSRTPMRPCPPGGARPHHRPAQGARQIATPAATGLTHRVGRPGVRESSPGAEALWRSCTAAQAIRMRIRCPPVCPGSPESAPAPP